MLFNPNWANVFTTASFYEWLRKQPKDKKYHFCDVDNCAIAQYLKSNGVDHVMDIDRMKELGWVDIVCTGGVQSTFGGAAKRAKLKLIGGWRLRLARCFGIAGLL